MFLSFEAWRVLDFVVVDILGESQVLRLAEGFEALIGMLYFCTRELTRRCLGFLVITGLSHSSRFSKSVYWTFRAKCLLTFVLCRIF